MDLCRICLATTDVRALDATVQKMVCDILLISIAYDDSLPKKICDRCFMTVSSVHRLRIVAAKSQHLLLNKVKDGSINNDSVEYNADSNFITIKEEPLADDDITMKEEHTYENKYQANVDIKVEFDDTVHVDEECNEIDDKKGNEHWLVPVSSDGDSHMEVVKHEVECSISSDSDDEPLASNDNPFIMTKRTIQEKESKQKAQKIFRNEWEDLYFFIKRKDNAVCVICETSISTLKTYNLKRHYENKHGEYDKLTFAERKAKLQFFKNKMTTRQKILDNQTAQSKSIVSASFRISYIIAKRMKPLSDGDYIKECIIAAVEECCPEKVNLITRISLSRNIVVRRITDISTEINKSLDKITKSFVYFSLALDETSDINDTAQLAIFIRGVDSQMNVTEELLDLVSLKDTTTGSDIKDAVVNCMQNHQIDLKKLIGITTDGAPSMVGENVGAVDLILEHIKALGNRSNDFEMFICHCFLHLENLCARVLNASNVMSVVVKVINLIKNNSSKHRQFQEYLRELESEYGDLIYCTKIRWLNRGNCLLRFWLLRDEIKIFMNENDYKICEFDDDQWLLDLCFLIDITMKLNELNRKLQGENKLITECYQHIKSFIRELKLFEHQLQSRDSVNFPLLRDYNSDRKDFLKYSKEVTKLIEEFESRFLFMQKHDEVFTIFKIPFDVNVESAPSNLQRELADLQTTTDLKCIYDKNNLEFYHLFENMFPKLKRLTMHILAAFGSTHRCESFFAKLKSAQTKFCNRSVDENITNQLRCASSRLRVNSRKLSKKIIKPVSH